MANESEIVRMSTDPVASRPPRVAEAILRLLLPLRDRETVSGDLLEAYRDTVVPARGSAAANRWYVFQVCSFLIRGSVHWGAVVGVALTARYLLDTLAPPADYKLRAAVLTYTLLGTLVVAGFQTGSRTRAVSGGVLTAFAAAILGGLLSIASTAIMLALWHDPRTLDAWSRSGGLQEAFVDVPLKILVIGPVAGLAGALLGKLVALSVPRRRSLG